MFLLWMIASTFAVEVVQIQNHSSVLRQSTSTETSTTDSGCDDACQVGQCHFGHCSHINFAQTTMNLIVPVLVAFDKTNSGNFQLSYSEQPTRPPRLS